jgi:hypothetical protein
MATLNLKRPSGSWGVMSQSLWNEISGTINADWDNDTIPPPYTIYTTYTSGSEFDGHDSVLQLSQSILDAWHATLTLAGYGNPTSSIGLEYKHISESRESNSEDRLIYKHRELPDGHTSYN